MDERVRERDWTPLPVLAPFHLEATVRVLQRRPANPVDVWSGDRYRRVLALQGGLVLVEVRDCGTIDEPDLRFRIHAPASAGVRDEAALLLRRILGLDVEPQPMLELASHERGLRATALALRGMRPPRFASLFEAVGSIVPFQQLSLDAGVAIVSRLVRRFGEPLVHGSPSLRAFPDSSAIARARPAALRACGLSGSKAGVLRKVARMIESGDLNEDDIGRLDTTKALGALTALPGIGPWSAALVLLRGFGRLDVFPPGDVGATRGLRSLLQLAPEAPLGPVEARFGNLRGYLYFYSLGASLLAKGLIHPAQGSGAREPAPRVRAVPRSARERRRVARVSTVKCKEQS